MGVTANDLTLHRVRRFKSSRLRHADPQGSARRFLGTGTTEHAPVAQRIEHLTTDQEVRGSNPFGRTGKKAPDLRTFAGQGLFVCAGRACNSTRTTCTASKVSSDVDSCERWWPDRWIAPCGCALPRHEILKPRGVHTFPANSERTHDIGTKVLTTTYCSTGSVEARSKTWSRCCCHKLLSASQPD